MGQDEQDGFESLKFNPGNSLWLATEFFLNSSPCQECYPEPFDELRTGFVEGGGRGENPFSSLGSTHGVTGWDEGLRSYPELS